MTMKIPVSKPYLNKKGREYLLDAYDTNWISSKGGYIEKFEQAWADYNGYKYGVATSSGTTALTVAMRAIDLKPGNEVIVPDFTMIASAWAVSYNAGAIRFVDCGDDLNINVSLLDRAINMNTRAIMPVHIYGRQCDMDEVMKIAYERNLLVIEDSCEAHGIKPRGDIACFSLFGNKIITSGEGGICLTNDPRLAEQMRHIRSMSFDKDHTFLHKKLGFNFRMTNMQAAVALSQVEMIDEILEKRKQIEVWYNEGLKDVDVDLKLMPKRDVLWMYDIRVRADIRKEFRKYLAENGVETRVFFKPMTEQPMYRSNTYTTTRAYQFSREGLYLPTYTDMTKKEVDYVCMKIREFFTKFKIKI